MSITITITDPVNISDAELGVLVVALGDFRALAKGGAQRTPLTPPAAHDNALVPGTAGLVIGQRDVPLLDPQDSPDAGLPVISPESAFASAPPAADLADAVAAFESTLPNVTAPSTPPAGTPPAPPNGEQTAGAPTLVNGVEVDRHGLPWDGRIHAGTKSKIKDGSWTAKRGRDETTVHAIEQELRALMAIPSPGTIVAPPPPAALAPVHVSPPPVVAPGQPAAPVVTPPPPPVAVPTPGEKISFPALLQKVAALVEGEKVLTQADIVGACAAVGVPSLPLAASRPDLLTMISDIIDATAAQRRGA